MASQVGLPMPPSSRATTAAALALCGASSALLQQLPEGPGRTFYYRLHAVQLFRVLLTPELAGALLARHAGLADELVGGLIVTAEDAARAGATEVSRLGHLVAWFVPVCVEPSLPQPLYAPQAEARECNSGVCSAADT